MSNSISETYNDTVKVVARANISVIKLLHNPYVKYGFLIFVVLRIIYIDKISSWSLEIFNYGTVKIIYALLVAYSACFDPVYAIALTTFIIICIQELYLRNAKKNMLKNTNLNTSSSSNSNSNSNSNNNNNSNTDNKIKFNKNNVETPTQTKIQISPTQTLILQSNKDITHTDLQIKENNIYNLINAHTLQKTPETKDTLINDYEINNAIQQNSNTDPAFTTLTNNIQTKSYLNKNYLSITTQDLSDIQTNQQQLLENQKQNLAQISFPQGFDTHLPEGEHQLLYYT